jgi:hypothetical protein
LTTSAVELSRDLRDLVALAKLVQDQPEQADMERALDRRGRAPPSIARAAVLARSGCRMVRQLQRGKFDLGRNLDRY